MNVFGLRDNLIKDYEQYIRSFFVIKDSRISAEVDRHLSEGALWPDPLLQLNPSFERGKSVDELVTEGVLHEQCRGIFRIDKTAEGGGKTLRLHRHQEDAIRTAAGGHNYVLTTGTGSGKSLAYIVPIVDHVLQSGSRKGLRAIVVYPMNALANSQKGELEKFLQRGFAKGRPPVTFERYTGQENEEERSRILANPPDILLTNFVMLELILTRPRERAFVEGGKLLRFLVLDELHTYRGRQGADVAMLVRRLREAFGARQLQCVGTSATLAGPGTAEEQRQEVARVASQLFGVKVLPENVIGETLRRGTPSRNFAESIARAELSRRIESGLSSPLASFKAFLKDPLSSWIEGELGLATAPVSGRLVRAEPRNIGGADGAAALLATATGAEANACRSAIEAHLLSSYRPEVADPDTGFPPFAFRLHQFVSRGDTVHASLEPETARHLTLQGQQYVPGDRNRILLPLVFCRECGQEYYCVNLEGVEGARTATPRQVGDIVNAQDDGPQSGFLYLSAESPWPTTEDGILERVPEDWLEEHHGSFRVKHAHRKKLPYDIHMASDGTECSSGANGLAMTFMPAPFHFCLLCGVSYGSSRIGDYTKLATLATEGRSTATTILSLSAVRHLRGDGALPPDARKLLSFTDNRQDASLQAGHFNDFVEVGLLEGGIWAEVTVCHNDIEDDDYAFYIEEMKPIQLSRFEFEQFLEGRKRFSRDEWIDCIIRTLGLEPARMSRRLKFHHLARLFPFVEANYNFIELGPRGTGKSYAYSEFSPYSTLISGGQATTPILFYNNARGKVGLVGFWDIVAFDEAAGIRIKDQDSIQIMKDYMANGRFSRGVEVIANASLCFVGNIDYSIDQLVNSANFDLFYPLSEAFDLAVMDRLYTYLPGWEIPKNTSAQLTGSYGFIIDYLAEAFHHLFLHTNRYDWVNKHLKLGKAVEGRDEVAIKKTVCAFLKLLHPIGDPAPDELDEYVEYASEGRRRVKEQMNKRKNDDEYAHINLSFFDCTGTERVVFCPESKGSESALNPKRKVIDDTIQLRADKPARQSIRTALKKKAEGPGGGEILATLKVLESAETEAQQERHFKILYGSTGHTYDRIFGPYLRGASKVEVEDPYIRSTHQIANFIRFCELLVKAGTIRDVRLVTGFESESQKTDIQERLDTLAQSLLERDVKLTVKLDTQMHDREVRFDNGWRVKIGRGLDFYQPPESWFVIGSQDMELRPCLETMVDIFKA